MTFSDNIIEYMYIISVVYNRSMGWNFNATQFRLEELICLISLPCFSCHPKSATVTIAIQVATSCMHASPCCDNACSQIIIQSMAQKSSRAYDDDDDEDCQERIIKTWSSITNCKDMN